MPRRAQQGFTIIELLMSILIFTIAMGGIMAVMSQTVLRSADPAITEQAIAIAEGYMDEIMAKEYADPDGAADAGRATWDDVGDYNALAEAPTDQNGNAIGALAGYAVAVTVDAPAVVNGESLRHVSVTVTHGATGIAYTLDGYRAIWGP